MVSYIIVSYNTSKLTVECVKSILDNCSDYEVIVVDNGSRDDTVSKLNETFAKEIASDKLKVLDTKTNNGFSKGNNIGASVAKGGYYVFINPDTIVKSDLSAELTEPLKTKYKGKDVLIAPKILNSDLTVQHSVNCYPLKSIGLLIKHFKNKIFKNKSYLSADWITGVCYCVKKETFEKLGGWNEEYDLYSEDLDFCYRINKKLNGKVILYNCASIIHYGNQSGKQIYTTDFASFEKKENALRKFYNIYYNDNKFYKWLKFVSRFKKSDELNQYMEKYFGEKK